MAEEDPWGFDDGDIVAEESTPAAGAATPGEAAAGGAAGGEETRPEMDVPAMDESSYRKPVTLYKHWVRCVHLLYSHHNTIQRIECRATDPNCPHPSSFTCSSSFLLLPPIDRDSCSTTICTTIGTTTTMTS